MSLKGQYPREYRAWQDMRTRCNNPKFIGYAMYGGRGIKVDERWEDFACFLDDMGCCPKGYWLDRCDNNQGYGPDNCRWATPKEQARNTRRNVFLTVNGQSLTVAEWSERTGISRYTIYTRIKAGLTDEECLREPVSAKRFATFCGETLSLEEWGMRLGIDAETVSVRLKRWPIERALTASKMRNSGRKPMHLSVCESSIGSRSHDDH